MSPRTPTGTVGTSPAALSVPRSRDQEVRGTLCEVDGNRFLNLRVWRLPPVPANWRPTEHGFTLPVDALPALRDLLAALVGDAVERGWLAPVVRADTGAAQ